MTVAMQNGEFAATAIQMRGNTDGSGSSSLAGEQCIKMMVVIVVVLCQFDHTVVH